MNFDRNAANFEEVDFFINGPLNFQTFLGKLFYSFFHGFKTWVAWNCDYAC